MNLTVLIKGGEGRIYLENALVIEEPSEIVLKSAVVYWDYNNVVSDVIVKGVTFEQGYWTFNMIRSELEEANIVVTEQHETGLCKVEVDETTNLKFIGELLGFAKDTELKTGTTTSSNTVDINRKFRHIIVSSNIVDKSKNIDQNGKRSDVITNIPIPTDRSLKGTSSHYNDINKKVSIDRGTYSFLEFNVKSNVVGNDRIVGDILLELYITPRIK